LFCCFISPANPFVGLETASLPAGPPTPLLDALKGGDESGWTHVESDQFVMFTSSNATHLASDMMAAPYAHWSDGCWDIVLVKDVPKMALMKLFTALETGEHVDSEYVTYIKCKAFRLEPDQSYTESFLDVDGEKMPSYGPTYSEMHRGMLNLVTL
jgi:diacylglycerol kinase family enzyme